MFPLRILRTALAAVALALLPAPLAAQEADWSSYTDPRHGYSIDLPVGLMDQQDGSLGRVVFTEPGGGALVLYAEPTPDGRGIADLAEDVTRSSGVTTVTYRNGGESWFVVSGYMQAEVEGAEELIFYIKLMLSADREHYAVFALQYPRSAKARYDAVVARLEGSFRPPR